MKKTLSRTCAIAVLSLSHFLAIATGNSATLETNTTADGWKGMSARAELQPAFRYEKNGGPNKNGSLIIEADNRMELDGHWTKTFPVQGGQFYRFHAARRASNLPAPRRNAFARILW